MNKWGNRPINKENVLSYISEYDIFKYYCTPFKKLGEAFCSELRVDNRPTCYIINYNSRLLYKDFAGESHDCFSYVMKKYELSFVKCLETIVSDFRLPLGFGSHKNTLTNGFIGSVETNANKINIKSSPTEIKVVIRPWLKHDKTFWYDKYKITTKDLIFYKVYPLSAFYINDTFIRGSDFTYGYYFGESSNLIHQWKIYNPYAPKGQNNKSGKWFSNCERGQMQGLDQLDWLDNLLIITKSLKDVIVLRKLGINAIAPHGEGHFIDESLMHSLTQRFKHISLIYDNDFAGIQSANKISTKYNLDNIVLPFGYGKDVSDFVEKLGYNELRKYLASHYSKLGIRIPEISENIT